VHGRLKRTHQNTFAEIGHRECFIGENQCPIGRYGVPIQRDGIAVPSAEIAGVAIGSNG